MATRGRQNSGRRDVNAIATRSVPARVVMPRAMISPLRPVDFSRPLFFDRRSYHPYIPFAIDSVRRDQRRLVVRGRRAQQIGFAVPDRVSVCVRRHRRRQVLFASGVGGSRRRKRNPRRNEYSNVRC